MTQPHYDCSNREPILAWAVLTGTYVFGVLATAGVPTESSYANGFWQ